MKAIHIQWEGGLPSARRSVSGTVAACSALALLAALGFASPARAQSADPAPSTGDEAVDSGAGEIIVTARRRDERLQDVPAAITAIGQADIERYSVASITDAAKMVPQLLVSRTATGTSSQIFLRGVGSSTFTVGFDQSVSINIDGVQISRGNAIQIGYLDLAQLEVLKGPQALYFGKNSPGGIISIATTNPTNDTSLSFKGGYEFEARRKYVEVIGNAPITPTLSARVAVNYSDQDGYFLNDAVAYTDPRGFLVRGASHRRGDQSEDISGRLSLLFEPSDAFTANVKGFMSRKRGEPVPRQMWRCYGANGRPQPQLGQSNASEDCTINKTYTQFSAPEIWLPTWPDAGDGTQRLDVDTELLIGNMTYDTGPVSINSITAYYNSRATQFLDSGSGTLYGFEPQNYRAFSQEFRVATDLGGAFDAVLGGYFQDTRLAHQLANRFSPSQADPATGRYYSLDKRSRINGKTWSAFIEGILKVTPELELDAGVRWTKETKDYRTEFVYVTPSLLARYTPNKPLFGNVSEDNFSPQATITWRPNSDVTVYGAYKTGYKSGGFNASALPAPTVTTANDFRFKNETVDGFEFGAKFLLDDGRLSVNTAIYSFDYKDLQVLVYDSLTTQFNARNAGHLKTKGVEIDAVWKADAIADGLTLRGALAYNHARYQDYTGPCYAGQTPTAGCDLSFANGKFNEQLYSGRQPPKAPAWAGSGGALYEMELSGGNRLSFSGDARYTSKFNTHDALRPDTIQKSFWLFDSSIRFEHNQGWSLSLIGKNLADKLVVHSSGDNPQTGASTGTPNGVIADVNAIVGSGREIMLELGFRF